MTDTQSSAIDQIAMTDIILATIFLKTDDKRFKEEALAYGFKRVSETNERLRGLFNACGDGTSPESNTALENTLNFMHMGRILEHTGDLQHMYMTALGRRATEERLRAYSDGEILKKLKPISEEVWRYAQEYRR